MSYRRRARVYHFAVAVSGKGISAFCYDRPRAIDLSSGRYGWTYLRAQVTCSKCIARLAAREQLEREKAL
jgi:hypothetical protein